MDAGWMVERLERRFRFIAWTVAVQGIVILALAVTIVVLAVPKSTLRASAFVIHDKDGRKRGALAMGKKGAPGLFVYDAEDRVRISLMIVDDVPSMTLLDKGGTTRLHLSANHDGAGMTLSAADAKARVFITETTAGGILSMLDSDRKPAATLGVTSIGTALIIHGRLSSKTISAP